MGLPPFYAEKKHESLPERELVLLYMVVSFVDLICFLCIFLRFSLLYLFRFFSKNLWDYTRSTPRVTVSPLMFHSLEYSPPLPATTSVARTSPEISLAARTSAIFALPSW